MDYSIYDSILEGIVKKHGLTLHKFSLAGPRRDLYMPSSKIDGSGSGWTVRLSPPGSEGRTIVTLVKINYESQNLNFPADLNSLESVIENCIDLARERDRAGKDIEFSVYDPVMKQFSARHGIHLYTRNKENYEIRKFVIPSATKTSENVEWWISLTPPDCAAKTTVSLKSPSFPGKKHSFPATPETLESVLEKCVAIARKGG